MELRDYQCAAVEAYYRFLGVSEPEEGGLICLPTGSGKTPVIATLCRDAVANSFRVLVLSHVRELIQQNANHLARFGVKAGVYCAGLRRKESGWPVMVASVQSLFRTPEDAGKVNLVVVDEAHLIPDDDSSMYRSLLAFLRLTNPRLRVVGLTATPYRLESGNLVNDAGPFHVMVYQAKLIDLVNAGWLSRLVAKSAVGLIDTTGIKQSCGDFAADGLEAAAECVVEAAGKEIAAYASHRRATLVFAAGVDHARHLASIIESHGIECGLVFGNTPGDERLRIIERFRGRSLRCLVNCRVLTTGFDVPHVDLVAICTATMSKGLYAQMAGRGLRLAHGKDDCLLLDFGGNVVRHGLLDDEESAGKLRTCPECQAFVRHGARECPCGYMFPIGKLFDEREASEGGGRMPKHKGTADDVDPLTLDQLDKIETREVYDVESVNYTVHRKKNAPDGHPPTMRVTYQCGLTKSFNEFVCFQHEGFARDKARKWWRKRSAFPTPGTVIEAVDLCEMGGVAQTKQIYVVKGGGRKWPEIVGHELGEIPVDATALEIDERAAFEAGQDAPF